MQILLLILSMSSVLTVYTMWDVLRPSTLENVKEEPKSTESSTIEVSMEKMLEEAF